MVILCVEKKSGPGVSGDIATHPPHPPTPNKCPYTLDNNPRTWFNVRMTRDRAITPQVTVRGYGPTVTALHTWLVHIVCTLPH